MNPTTCPHIPLELLLAASGHNADPRRQPPLYSSPQEPPPHYARPELHLPHHVAITNSAAQRHRSTHHG